MQVRALRRSPKALVATMLAAVMIFGTTVATMAGIQDSMPDYESTKEISGLINSEASYAPGTQVTLSANSSAVADAGISGTVNADYHFEWYLKDTTTVATLNRKGVLTVSSTARKGSTATIVALVVNGAKAESGGSGSGPWYPVLEDILGYSEATFSVEGGTAYGWQGTGGLQIKLTDAYAASMSGEIEDVTGIVNTISGNIPLTDNGNPKFEIELSAGGNASSTAFTDNGNMSRVHVYKYDADNEILLDEAGTIHDDGINTSTKTLTLSVSGLEPGSYVLELDSTVQANNAAKTLGENIYFIFTYNE